MKGKTDFLGTTTVLIEQGKGCINLGIHWELSLSQWFMLRSFILRQSAIALVGLALVATPTSAQTVNWEQLRRACPQNPRAYVGSAAQAASMKEAVRRYLGATADSLEHMSDPTIYRGWGDISFLSGEMSSARQFLINPNGRVTELSFSLDFASGQHDNYRSLERMRNLGVSPEVTACLHEGARLFHF